MNRLVSSFEREIRSKIRQKADSYKQEEILLLRTFKFFDYQGEGLVEFGQFDRVMNRLSVTMLAPDQLRQVFSHYVANQHGPDSNFGRASSQEKLNYHIFVNKVLQLTRGKSADMASSRREPASVYGDSGNPFAQEQQVQMVSSAEFERALEDLRNGVKRMDMMYLLSRIHRRLDALPGKKELDQREIQQELMENGLPRKHQVRLLAGLGIEDTTSPQDPKLTEG